VQRSLGVITGAAALLLTACGASREVHVPALGALPAPTFATLPADLGDSPQLGALVLRDTAGLDPTEDSAMASGLHDALAALAALPDPPKTLTRLTIYADSIYFSYPQDGVAGREVSAIYEPGNDLRESEPSFSEAKAYALGEVDADVPADLVAGIERRFPSLRVTELDLEVSLSYDFGLVWNIEVDDARGKLASIYADLDGAIVAVDER